MEGYVRIIEALDFCLDKIDYDLNYKIQNSAISKCVKEFNGIDGNCKGWLKSIDEFSKVENFSTANSINLAYLTSRNIVREYIEELLMKYPKIDWYFFWLKMMFEFGEKCNKRKSKEGMFAGAKVRKI